MVQYLHKHRCKTFIESPMVSHLTSSLRFCQRPQGLSSRISDSSSLSSSSSSVGVVAGGPVTGGHTDAGPWPLGVTVSALASGTWRGLPSPSDITAIQVSEKDYATLLLWGGCEGRTPFSLFSNCSSHAPFHSLLSHTLGAMRHYRQTGPLISHTPTHNLHSNQYLTCYMK